LKINRINPQNLLFADKGTVKKMVNEVENISREVILFQNHPNYAVPDTVLAYVKQLFDSGKYEILTV
jgi:hypothetical protein